MKLILLCVWAEPAVLGSTKTALKLKYVYSVQSYIHQVLQTIQMKLILLCVWAEPAVLGSPKTALKFKYKI